jgi:ABC-type Fe3+ transport system permease subunit
MNNISLVLPIGIVLAILYSLFYLVNVRKLTGYLKGHHPDVWQVLTQSVGGAVMGGSANIGMMILWRYLMEEEYKTLNDNELNRLASRVKVLLLVGLGLFALLFIIYAVSIIVNLYSVSH